MTQSAIEKVRQALQKRGEATRPQLAAATGLSLVSCNKAMAELCARGEAQEAGLVPSGGGRPVKQYRVNAKHAYGAYFQARRSGALIRGTMEICDMLGKVAQTHQAEFAYLGAESLDSWLDAATRRSHLYGITLEVPADILPERMQAHLETRYACPARLLNAADALADRADDTLTLYFLQGQSPVCSLRRGGKQIHTGELGLLPMPSTWSELDYSDHTLVEEMISRTITILACTLAPSRFVLYADFWTSRLTKRIHFNTSAKLRKEELPLQFHSITPLQAAERLRHFACRCFLA
ncbi:MAG: hypothetical protein II349_01365 [Akkermansia sp.]|nr:hypothetical protein [Akkermansia sp.]